MGMREGNEGGQQRKKTEFEISCCSIVLQQNRKTAILANRNDRQETGIIVQTESFTGHLYVSVCQDEVQDCARGPAGHHSQSHGRGRAGRWSKTGKPCAEFLNYIKKNFFYTSSVHTRTSGYLARVSYSSCQSSEFQVFLLCVVFYRGSWDSLLVRAPDSDRKVASLNPGWSGGRIFLSRINFVC